MHQSPQRRSRTFCRWGMRATKQRRKLTTNQSFHLSIHQISHAAGPVRRQIPHGSTYSLVLHRVQAWNRGHGGAHASASADHGCCGNQQDPSDPRPPNVLQCLRLRGKEMEERGRGGAAGRGEKGERARGRAIAEGCQCGTGAGVFLTNCDGLLKTTTCFPSSHQNKIELRGLMETY
jgi:hypothetical protein